jgi:hypothetical protein
MEVHEGSSIFRVWPSNEPLRGREGEGIAGVSWTVRSRGTFGWRRRTSGRAGRTWARFALSEARRPSVSSSRRVFPREARARPRSPWPSRPRAPPPARYALSCAFQGEKKIQPSPAALIICARGRDGRRPPDRHAPSTRVNERTTRSDPASDTASRARTCERVKVHAPRRGESPSRNGAFGGRPKTRSATGAPSSPRACPADRRSARSQPRVLALAPTLSSRLPLAPRQHIAPRVASALASSSTARAASRVDLRPPRRPPPRRAARRF